MVWLSAEGLVWSTPSLAWAPELGRTGVLVHLFVGQDLGLAVVCLEPIQRFYPASCSKVSILLQDMSKLQTVLRLLKGTRKRYPSSPGYESSNLTRIWANVLLLLHVITLIEE